MCTNFHSTTLQILAEEQARQLAAAQSELKEVREHVRVLTDAAAGVCVVCACVSIST
jgi:hypothetical protein